MLIKHSGYNWQENNVYGNSMEVVIGLCRHDSSEDSLNPPDEVAVMVTQASNIFDSDKVSISRTNVYDDWGWIVQNTVGRKFVNDHCDTSVYVAVVVISDARLHPSSVKNVGLELTYHIHNKPCKARWNIWIPSIVKINLYIRYSFNIF